LKVGEIIFVVNLILPHEVGHSTFWSGEVYDKAAEATNFTKLRYEMIQIRKRELTRKC